ncbi:MAG: hypothetical protein CFE23_09295 [Flavobacterium sp. BFFFF1]|uniref:hypothetical protein n=1 Tax=Flavobacterium sp. BFFFF1 TaxID=2015557 RepID=UPI000BC4053A|nr:hypothetical protein [Flavobacterium sp. BFFFF1]OYU80441.1 MAG: hypothetical protein CFE23_09295 [Flavobacterium sp. BFFFF1]
MINDQRGIEYFKKIAQLHFAVVVVSDYGIQLTDVTKFTDTISLIYRYLAYNTFKSVTIYSALTETNYLSALIGANPTTYSSYENITPLSGDDIVIEIKSNGELNISINYKIDIETLRKDSIIYNFDKQKGVESIYNKTTVSRLEPIPDSDSYFAIQSYKSLELALEDYKTKVAKHSDCPYLQRVWFDSNMLFFRKAPEHILRDSLTHFLKLKLRNAEIRPEQIVDKSHPVDIKVTWALANRLALIEIKWLGKSLKHRNKQFTKKFYPARALSGAKQLADYLDANLIQSPTYATMGYLVVFDARRAGCNKGTVETLNSTDALTFLNQEIVYNPEYHSIRTDFAVPQRYFMTPKYS